jgi:pimeloyl-ACP methyl ester carboxylesterase
MKDWYLILFLFFALLSCNTSQSQKHNKKTTICLIGGTPSTTDILEMLPDSLKQKYNFISFNRPGYGESVNEEITDSLLYELAQNAGLKKGDFGVIGVSGGGPFSILLASHFKLKHCGVISGMVSKEAFFSHADGAVTKQLMENVLAGYNEFEEATLQFPNVDEIMKQAGTTNKEMAIRACYDDLNYILSKSLYKAIQNKKMTIDWWHGEKDVNVPLESVKEFIKDYPNTSLHIISEASHVIDSNIYVGELINEWEN